MPLARLSLLRSAAPSAAARLALLALALLQVIAPSWHVCEWSGAPCCPHSIATPHDMLPDKLSALTQEQPACHHAQRMARRVSHGTPALASHETAIGFTGTCLARLLWNMPGGLAAAFSLSSHSLLQAELPLPLHRPRHLPAWRQPPARGPPLAMAV